MIIDLQKVDLLPQNGIYGSGDTAMFDLIEQEEAGIQLPVEQVEFKMFVCYIFNLFVCLFVC